MGSFPFSWLSPGATVNPSNKPVMNLSGAVGACLGPVWAIHEPVTGGLGPGSSLRALCGPVCLSGPVMSLSGGLWSAMGHSGTLLGARRELSGGFLGVCLPVWACHEHVRGSLGRSGALWGTLGALRELSGASLGTLRELVGARRARWELKVL